MKVSALAIYPVKSLGPVALERARVEPRGLAGDRRWLIVDENNRFVTRREFPVLARITISAEADGGYRLVHPDGEARLDQEVASRLVAPVVVWRDTVDAVLVENEASALISSVAGRSLRLAYMAEESIRPVDPAHARPNEIVSFADGYPVLVTTEASLAALNAALEAPVEMTRFRPNIVLTGDMPPWSEAGWDRLTVGDARLRFTKPCSRCIVITQHPETGEREEGNAVPRALRRLGQFSREGALFGMNAVPEVQGEVSAGNEASVA